MPYGTSGIGGAGHLGIARTARDSVWETMMIGVFDILTTTRMAMRSRRLAASGMSLTSVFRYVQLKMNIG